jgi:hypothetical protein
VSRWALGHYFQPVSDGQSLFRGRG